MTKTHSFIHTPSSTLRRTIGALTSFIVAEVEVGRRPTADVLALIETMCAEMNARRARFAAY